MRENSNPSDGQFLAAAGGQSTASDFTDRKSSARPAGKKADISTGVAATASVPPSDPRDTEKPDGTSKPANPQPGVGADQTVHTVIPEWDESAAELRINGYKIEDCPAWIIRRTGLDEGTFKRNAFIYTQCMLNVCYKTIRSQIRESDRIDSVQGIRAAGRRFAKRFRLPEPAPRQDGRRSQ